MDCGATTAAKVGGQEASDIIRARGKAAFEDPLLSIIQAAGWPIWPLLLCSIIALALIIERFYHLRSNRVAPRKQLDEVITVTRTNLPGADVVNKLAASSVLGGVFAAGLRSVIAEPRISEDALRLTFENAGREAVHGTERYLNTIAHRFGRAPARPSGNGDRHDRDLRLASSQRRQQPAADGTWHLGGALQHRLRLDHRGAGLDVLSLLPWPRRRIPVDHGAGR